MKTLQILNNIPVGVPKSWSACSSERASQRANRSKWNFQTDLPFKRNTGAHLQNLLVYGVVCDHKLPLSYGICITEHHARLAAWCILYVYDSSMFTYIWSPNDLNACRSELPAMVIHFPDCIIACAVLDHPPLNVQMQISYLVEQIINHVWALYRQCFLVHKLIRKQQHNETE